MAAAPLLFVELLSIWRQYRRSQMLSFSTPGSRARRSTGSKARAPKSSARRAEPKESAISSGEELVDDSISSGGPTRNSSVDVQPARAPARVPDPNNNKVNQALFFPDDEKKPPCTSYHFKGNCEKRQCFESHNVDSSIGQLARYILLARDSIDVCQYSITSSFLTEAILRRHHLGVRVRVITDHEGANILSSQMEEFYKQGIQVRPHRGSGLMHHKFIVIDNKIVATGSFNFTAQATLENYENIVVSDNMDIVGRYIQNFAKMWKRFDYAPAAAKQARM